MSHPQELPSLPPSLKPLLLDELVLRPERAQEFLARTVLTQGLREMLQAVLERLGGSQGHERQDQAVFRLAHGPGRGKTHALMAAAVAAANPAAIPALGDPGLTVAALYLAGARVVMFDGLQAQEPFWEVLARQLHQSHPARRKSFWDPVAFDPGEESWVKLLRSNVPTLIVLDNMPRHFAHLADQPLGFGTMAHKAVYALANLVPALDTISNACLVLSDLRTPCEPEPGEAVTAGALDMAAKAVARMERIITPVDPDHNELYELVRGRIVPEDLSGEKA